MEKPELPPIDGSDNFTSAEEMGRLSNDEQPKIERHSPEHTAQQMQHIAEMGERRAQRIIDTPGGGYRVDIGNGVIYQSKDADMYGNAAKDDEGNTSGSTILKYPEKSRFRKGGTKDGVYTEATVMAKSSGGEGSPLEGTFIKDKIETPLSNEQIRQVAGAAATEVRGAIAKAENQLPVKRRTPARDEAPHTDQGQLDDLLFRSRAN
jgi:hypothetical protein